jgi:hypothetical protein
LNRLAEHIDHGLSSVEAEQAQLRPYVEDLRGVAATLNPAGGPTEKRQESFFELQRQFACSTKPIHQTFSKIMQSFACGLFVGGDDPDLPHDNLDLERFFRLPKSHERKIHGRHHAGTRIVHEGPTLVPTLDAHLNRQQPFSQEELFPYANAAIPTAQQESLHRRRVMRQARSLKCRPKLLLKLEQRYAGAQGLKGKGHHLRPTQRRNFVNGGHQEQVCREPLKEVESVLYGGAVDRCELGVEVRQI